MFINWFPQSFVITLQYGSVTQTFYKSHEILYIFNSQSVFSHVSKSYTVLDFPVSWNAVSLLSCFTVDYRSALIALSSYGGLSAKKMLLSSCFTQNIYLPSMAWEILFLSTEFSASSYFSLGALWACSFFFCFHSCVWKVSCQLSFSFLWW